MRDDAATEPHDLVGIALAWATIHFLCSPRQIGRHLWYSVAWFETGPKDAAAMNALREDHAAAFDEHLAVHGATACPGMLAAAARSASR
jgi:hypothetical protein